MPQVFHNGRRLETRRIKANGNDKLKQYKCKQVMLVLTTDQMSSPCIPFSNLAKSWQSGSLHSLSQIQS